MVEARVMSEEESVTKLKIMIVGPEKNGKSRLAATGRAPILFHDHDNRAEAMNGIPGVYVISYKEPPFPKIPEACQEQLDILDQLEHNMDISKLKLGGKPLFPTVPENTIVRTNVIDSLATVGKHFQDYAMFTSPGIRRDVNMGKFKVMLPGGWDAWNAETKSVEPTILRFLALPTDTILTLHETPEEAPDSTPEAKKFTGRVSIYPARYQLLLKYFNEVWRIRLTNINGNYLPRVYVQPTYEFDSATAMLLDKVESPNISSMMAKHEERVKALPSGQTPITAQDVFAEKVSKVLPELKY